MNSYEKIALEIKKAKRVTFLTGAGISTQSGIPDFRSSKGLYNNGYPVEEILSTSFFKNNPDLFWIYFKEIFNFKIFENYKPNFGHIFLKKMEDYGKQTTVLTQNVDGLHLEAGSSNVYEMHGSIKNAFCTVCHQYYNLSYIKKYNTPKCPNDNTILKPDVVLFGDMVRHYDKAYKIVTSSDLLMVLGSSLEVYPVNQLPSFVSNASSIFKILINNNPTKLNSLFNIVLHEDINSSLKKIESYF
jgi:NAD-dependent deacetylase